MSFSDSSKLQASKLIGLRVVSSNDPDGLSRACITEYYIHTLAPVVRFVRPGDIVTMDYQPRRLNVILDANLIVTRVSWE